MVGVVTMGLDPIAPRSMRIQGRTPNKRRGGGRQLGQPFGFSRVRMIVGVGEKQKNWGTRQQTLDCPLLINLHMSAGLGDPLLHTAHSFHTVWITQQFSLG